MDNSQEPSQDNLISQSVLQCQSCAANLSSKTALVHFQKLVFNCQYCGSENHFTSQQLNPSKQSDAKPSVKQLLSTRPQDININESGGKLTISYRWRSDVKSSLIAIIAPLAWTALVLFNTLNGSEFHWVFVFFYCVGGLAIYKGLAQFVNHTTIVFNQHSMQISHGPLRSFGRNAKRWPKYIEWNQSAIDKLIITKFSNKNEQAQIVVLLKDGVRVQLFKKYLRDSEAKFILARIQQHLL